MAEAEETLQQRTVLTSSPKAHAEANDFRNFIISLALDTAKNGALLIALSFIFFVARWLERLGMDASHLRHIQELHFWVTYAALTWIGIVFLVKLVRRSFE